MTMSGKVAIVTGAGSGGCGQAIARRFAREGTAVVVSDISESGIAATVARIHEEGGRAEPLLGAMHLTRYAIEAMRRGSGGAIVHFGSTSGLHHRPSRAPAYDVAKAGVMRLATSLGWLKEAHGIRVNCIVPDWLATPQVVEYVDGLTPEQRGAQKVPPLTPIDDIVEAVLRLATDEALFARALVWWSGRRPGLIPVNDHGYSSLYPLAE